MDLVGKKIHELKILERYRKDERTYYKVRCSCGKEFETRRDSITSNRTKSCGHLTQFKGKNLLGQKFERLTVIESKGVSKKGRQLWKCVCDCENTITVDTSSLTTGNTKSCGCIFNEMLEKNQDKYQKKIFERHRKEQTYLPALNSKLPKNNTSGTKGVYWDKSRKKWVARIYFKGKNIFLGRYNEKDNAIQARKIAETKYFKPIINKYKRNFNNKEIKDEYIL